MKLNYHLIDPTKNITALASFIEPSRFAEAAAAIMRQEPACEQVGFVSRRGNGELCLDMAGGEFCGNASLSAAALRCSLDGLPCGETRKLRLHVSGADAPVNVTVSVRPGSLYACDVTMPPPLSVKEETLQLRGQSYTLPAVYFPGIAHIIVPQGLLTDADAALAAREWCAALGTAGLGLMFYAPDARSLRPLVYVPKADTLFWESSCASGTAAVGAYTCHSTGEPADLKLAQPGGTLRIRADQENLLLSGTAKILKYNEIEI